MKKNYKELAEEYYTLVGEKDLEGMKKYLHPDVEFSSPFFQLKGREPFMEKNQAFIKMFTSLKIRASFDSEDQAVIIYDTDIPGIQDEFPAVSWLRFRDGLIDRVQLFFDKSAFV